VLLASDYPFPRIIGVEYAEPLHRAAVENIQRYRSTGQRCHDIESVCADAMAFQPPDSPLVCLFFNPFDDATTARVLDNLRESVQSSPRPCLVLYVNIRDTGEKRHIFQPAFGGFWVVMPKLVSRMRAARPRRRTVRGTGPSRARMAPLVRLLARSSSTWPSSTSVVIGRPAPERVQDRA